MIIDAHQHFWKYSPQNHSWINDTMSVLKKDFLPEDLFVIYQENGIYGCVSVQAEQSEEETDFLLKLADQYDFIKGVVGWLDLRSNDLDNRLEYYQQFEKLKGFRHMVQDEPDPDFLLDAAFQKGLGELEKRSFTYDLLVYPHQLKAAIQTVKKFPNLKFVLDHIGKPNIKNQEFEDWEQAIKTLALEQNIYCKVSGLITEASWKEWKQVDFTPYLDVVFQSFGKDRLMFGSDWPVCLLAGDFSKVIDLLKRYSNSFSEEDKNKLFYINAASFYGLS